MKQDSLNDEFSSRHGKEKDALANNTCEDMTNHDMQDVSNKAVCTGSMKHKIPTKNRCELQSPTNMVIDFNQIDFDSIPLNFEPHNVINSLTRTGVDIRPFFR